MNIFNRVLAILLLLGLAVIYVLGILQQDAGCARIVEAAIAGFTRA